MKRNMFLVLIMMFVVTAFSQNYQQTNLVLDMEVPKDQSVVYEASASIMMLDGFCCKPNHGASAEFSIDRFGVFPPDEGLTGGFATSAQDGVVGALPGKLTIGDIGAAIYRIPIMMPQGIGKMTPEIALTYNSQAGNGIAGWAWDLTGLSAIVRTGQTVYHDGNRTAINFVDDRFMMDGNRLMLCSGNYGGNDAVYKTEFDEMSKIVSYTDGYSGPARFVVYKKDGTIWEYGCTDDSRVEPQYKNDVVLMWLVNKIIDPDGNCIVFHYYENQSSGESYINSIDYTLNENMGIQTMYRVLFDYSEREDAEIGYVYDNQVQRRKLLRNVTIKNMASGTMLYKYSLDYDYEFMYNRLKSIGLAADGMKLNPTIINWNKPSHYSENFLSYPQSQDVFNKVPFVGDFNGDGYSDALVVPYKIGNSYTSNVQASVYLNKGDGVFDKNAFYTFTFDKTLEWVYIVDFDGDGLDDVVPYYANFDNNETWKAKIQFYKNHGGSFSYVDEKLSNRYFTVYPGDFFGERKVGFFLNYDNNGYSAVYYPSLVYYSNNSIVMQSLGTQAYSYVPERVVVQDVNGDGCSEIIYLMNNSSVVAKLQWNYDHYDFFHLFADNQLDSDDFLFPGDFNGDGYVDFLKYDNRTYWKVVFSDGKKFKTPVSCQNNNLLRNVVLAPQDRYLYSLQNLSMPSETIRIADFDGDGKADVGVFKNTGGNYYMEIGLKMCANANNSYGFNDSRRYYLGINHGHQYVHVGNFLGHENASILGSVKSNYYNSEIPKIVSLNPHSAKFSVERITDGLGNQHGFCYDYLMPDNEIYEYDYQWINQNVRTVALPVKALLADTVFSTNNNPCVTRYSYKNLLYHTDGHGLLGFERSESKLLINNVVHERGVMEMNAEDMADNFIILPKTYSKYSFSDQLIMRSDFSYRKYACVQNDRVFMPMLTLKKTVDYDPDSPGSMLKTAIENIDYQSDAAGNEYYDVVNTRASIVGKDYTCAGDDASSCKFITETSFIYNNDISRWVVNRLLSVKESMRYEDNEAVGTCTIFDYSSDKPYRVTRKTALPNTNLNYADPLKVVTEYSYDAAGHVVMQSMSTPSNKSQKVIQYDYGEEYNYRFPTKTINENGWEVSFSYDNDYGNMHGTLDYNMFETVWDSDPFAVTKESVQADGVKNVKAKRWASGNRHAPQKAAYYCWEKSSGNAEQMTFFSKNGQKLRDVTFGLNGEAIYVDMAYDDRGNVLSQSMPYNPGDDIKNHFYVYDKNNRLTQEISSDGLVKSYSYNGLQRSVNTASAEGVSHNVVETYNPVGWRVQTVDIGGNTIDYEYYSDGKIKNAMINGNPMTKVEYEYDGLRNMLKMKDSSIGEVLYEYDAYGNLKSMTTAKNCVTTYNYDNVGNILSRVEMDEKGQNRIETQWVYDNSQGKIGMVSQINYGDTHNVAYNYDDLLRLVNVTETINGQEYSTSYSYDGANRVESVVYPSGLAVQRKYSNSGCYTTMINQHDGAALWRTDGADALGNITAYHVGNGFETHREYDVTGRLTGINTTYDGKRYQDLAYSYDGFGNLTNRTNNCGTKRSETFAYDNFNRLVEISLNGFVTGEMAYDIYGNILSKTIDNQTVYYDARYNGTSPYAVSKVKTDLDDLNGMNQTVDYTTFDKISHISSGNNSLSIDYGYNHERIRLTEDVDGLHKEKVYVGDCEYVNENGENMVYTYLSGPMGVFAVCRTDAKGNDAMFFIHKDHLNSWCMITDENGQVVQKTSYDAWGNPRNDATWSGEYTGELLCDRGFTGHEHLSGFGIINMNGRAYDPMLSMMMSPDNYIQNSDFSQNYNRYIYCYNNPLSYCDPSGEWVEWLMYGVFNGVVNVMCNIGSIDSFSEGLLAFGAGFVSGCLTQGCSECAWWVQVVGSVAGTTLKSGVNSFVGKNTGPELDWGLLETASYKEDVMYALGSSIAKSVLSAYIVQPTDSDEGKTLANILCKEKHNRRLLETTSKKIVGNIFAGRKMFAGFGISKNNLEDIVPYIECVADIFIDNVEIETSSETLSNISDKLLNFDFKGVMSKFGSDANYCYSQIRALFLKNGE